VDYLLLGAGTGSTSLDYVPVVGKHRFSRVVNRTGFIGNGDESRFCNIITSQKLV